MTTEGPRDSGKAPSPVPPAREPLAASPPASAPDDSAPAGPAWLWQKIKHHKVVEWTLAYIAFAYALLHVAEMLTEAQEWPHIIVRVLSFALILAVPIVMTVAWYHGHKARHRISTPELVIITLLLFVTSSVLWWFSKPRGEAASMAPPSMLAGTSTASVAPPENSIAVLPFVDLSEKRDQEYFADGMAEEILDLLARIPDLKVIGRTSSFQFRGRNEDLRHIGTTLGASYLLEGSVRRTADQVRVTGQLIETHDGSHRWSQSYDRPVGNVLSLEDEIAAAIARELQITIQGDEARTVANEPEARAHDLYLRALRALDAGSRADEEQAVAFFDQALHLDPNFAPAAVGLGKAYTFIGEEAWIPPAVAFAKAKEAATRALRIDPNSGAAYAVLARAKIIGDWDWAGAAADIARAKTLGGGVEALLAEGALAAALGHWNEATHVYQQAIALDRLNPNLIMQRAFLVELRSGRCADAEASMRNALQIREGIGTGHWFLGISLLCQGRGAEALPVFSQETVEDGRFEGSAMANHALGKHAESDKYLQLAIKQNGDSWASAIARVYAFRGEIEKSMEWLDRAYSAHDEDLYFINHDPLLGRVADDPRFHALLRKLNLPE